MKPKKFPALILSPTGKHVKTTAHYSNRKWVFDHKLATLDRALILKDGKFYSLHGCILKFHSHNDGVLFPTDGDTVFKTAIVAAALVTAIIGVYFSFGLGYPALATVFAGGSLLTALV